MEGERGRDPEENREGEGSVAGSVTTSQLNYTTLERYEELIERAVEGDITVAEVQVLIKAFDQGELYLYQHSRDLSISLLKEWLVKYKFKNWSVTRTRKKRVTRAMKTARAKAIAEKLNDTKKWHLHGHGISKDVLELDVGVIIDDFGVIPKLSACIREYHDLLADYMAKLRQTGTIHFPGAYRPFMLGG